MTRKQPLFSIITACRNSESTIERTFQSVLSQTFCNYEYIVVDGASTDSTVDIIKKYEPLFNGKLKWISEKDTGIYNAFNKGIRMCHGQYIWIVNSDDWIERDALTILHAFIKRNPKPVIIGRMNLITGKNGIIKSTKPLSVSEIKMVYKKDHMIPHPATLITNSTYHLYGYYDENLYIAADMDLFNRLYKNHVEMACINKVLTNFTYGGISTRRLYKKEFHDRHIVFSKKYGHSINYIMAMLRWHFQLIKRYIDNG